MIKTINKAEAIDLMNQYGHKHEAFVFFIDFDMERIIILNKEEQKRSNVYFDFRGYTNTSSHDPISMGLHLEKYPISFQDYHAAFDQIKYHLKRGESYLTNLTFSTPIHFNWSLGQIYGSSRALYKGYIPNQFTFFSPETFVSIAEGYIYAHPMKGTIDARLPGARQTILSDPKETAEHSTIVDLLRNDLSQICHKVEVDRFRYLSLIEGHDRKLIHVSSSIKGQLNEGYLNRLGTDFFSLLPAGSITGAPKKRTIEIIKEVESSNRGYYTGVCGYFDGQKLDSGIMIRMISERDGSHYYHSGGGITHQSKAQNEYDELLNKIYVPISRDNTYLSGRSTEYRAS